MSKYEVCEVKVKENELISIRNNLSKEEADQFAESLNKKTKSKYTVRKQPDGLKHKRAQYMDDYVDKEARRFQGAWGEIHWQAKDALNTIKTKFSDKKSATRDEMYEATEYNINMIESMIGRLKFPTYKGYVGQVSSIANRLDEKGMFKEADILDNIYKIIIAENAEFLKGEIERLTQELKRSADSGDTKGAAVMSERIQQLVSKYQKQKVLEEG